MEIIVTSVVQHPSPLLPQGSPSLADTKQTSGVNRGTVQQPHGHSLPFPAVWSKPAHWLIAPEGKWVWKWWNLYPAPCNVSSSWTENICLENCHSLLLTALNHLKNKALTDKLVSIPLQWGEKERKDKCKECLSTLGWKYTVQESEQA